MGITDPYNITAIRPGWEIIRGDAPNVLLEFAPYIFDEVIIDPPYAFGCRTKAKENKSTDKKYSSMGESWPPCWRATPPPALRLRMPTLLCPRNGSLGSWPRVRDGLLSADCP